MLRSTRHTRATNAPSAFALLLLAGLLGFAPATSFASAPTPQFLESWPCAGCRGVTVAADGDVYALSATEVRHFTGEGTYVDGWSLPPGSGDRIDAYGIAADPYGHLFVTDFAGGRLTKFTEAGAVVLEVGSPGTAPGQIAEPLGVACDGQGNVYVGDVRGAIQKFSGAGQYLLRLASNGWQDGEFITVLGITIGPTGTVFATDWQNCRVQALSPTGGYLYRIGSPACGDICPPFGITLDPGGTLYVADPAGRILMYRATGECLGEFGTPGEGEGQLGMPFGLAIDRQGRVLVADERHGRIQVFGYPVVPARRSTWGALKTIHR